MSSDNSTRKGYQLILNDTPDELCAMPGRHSASLPILDWVILRLTQDYSEFSEVEFSIVCYNYSSAFPIIGAYYPDSCTKHFLNGEIETAIDQILKNRSAIELRTRIAG